MQQNAPPFGDSNDPYTQEDGWNIPPPPGLPIPQVLVPYYSTDPSYAYIPYGVHPAGSHTYMQPFQHHSAYYSHPRVYLSPSSAMLNHPLSANVPGTVPSNIARESLSLIHDHWAGRIVAPVSGITDQSPTPVTLSPPVSSNPDPHYPQRQPPVQGQTLFPSLQGRTVPDSSSHIVRTCRFVEDSPTQSDISNLGTPAFKQPDDRGPSTIRAQIESAKQITGSLCMCCFLPYFHCSDKFCRRTHISPDGSNSFNHRRQHLYPFQLHLHFHL